MRKISLVLSCGIAMSCTTSYAGDFTLSGFGTLSVSRLSTNDAEYVNNIYLRPSGASHDWNAGVDSKLGMQGAYKFNSDFSATVLAVAQHNPNDSYYPRVQAAYVAYKITPSFELRAGRLPLPAYMLSDYLNVNYSLISVRGPDEVYSSLAFTTIDGADALWRTKVGNANLTVQPVIGRARARMTTGNSHADTAGINVVGEIGNWTLRAGYLGAKVTLDVGPVNQLIDALNSFGVTNIAQRLSYKDQRSSFAGLGLAYDNGTLVLQSEYTQRRAHAFVPDTDAWYVLGGYRIGEFTPYATLASLKTVSATRWNDVPAPFDSTVNGLLASSNASQKSLSLGLRWDFAKNFAAKAQFSHIKPEDGSASGLLLKSPGTGPASAQNLITLSLDTVF